MVSSTDSETVDCLSGMRSDPTKAQAAVSLSKKPYSHCSVSFFSRKKSDMFQ